MSKIYSYCRVSHANSADSGLSITDQLQRAKDYASTVIPGIPYCANFSDEAVSGWKLPLSKRPEGSKLLKLLEPGDHLVCYSIDRLSRNVKDFANLMDWMEKRGILLHFISERINAATAIGKLQLHMRAAMAQFTSDLISERTREALAIRRLRRGQPLSKRRKKRIWVPSEFGMATAESALERKTGQIHMYQRCSTEKQYTSSLGLDAQEESIKSYAKRLSTELACDIGEMYSDPAISAFKVPFAERPAGKQLLENLQPGDDVVVYRLDRMWRCPKDALEVAALIHEKGAYLHFVNEGIRTDTAQGSEWITLLASIAHMESAQKSERSKSAARQGRAEGRPAGQIQAGYRAKEIDGKAKLEIDPDHAVELAKVWVMYEEYNLKSKQINNAIASFKCKKEGREMQLEDLKDYHPSDKKKQALRIRDRMAESLWIKYVCQAKEELEQPIEKKHWRLNRWEWPFGVTA